MPCILVDGYNHFGGIWCCQLLGYNISLEVAGFSEM